MNNEAAKLVDKPGYYILYDDSPIAGPYDTVNEAYFDASRSYCSRIRMMFVRIEYLDPLEKDPV